MWFWEFAAMYGRKKMQKCPDNYDAFEWHEREQERLRRHFRDWDDEGNDDDFEEEEYE